jgi:molecular chaperone DnaJ
MPDINEAYHVLGDPARRANYDAALRDVAPRAPTTTTAPVPRPPVRPAVDTTPARIPWKLMLAMAGLGSAVVLVGAALYEPAGPERPDNLLEPGSCVAIEGNGDAREVTCTGEVQLVVEALVPIGERCPDGTAGHRDRQGRGLACVRSLP